MKKNILVIAVMVALLVTACAYEPTTQETVIQTEPAETETNVENRVVFGSVSSNLEKESSSNNDITYLVCYNQAATMSSRNPACTITITKEWYENAYVYAAHLEFSDYSRLKTGCANGKYNSGRETTSHAAKRLGALLCVNGDYAVPSNGASGYAIVRDGVVYNDKPIYSEGIYNHYTGLLTYRTYDSCSGKQSSDMVEAGKITDTFQFGPAFLLDGVITGVSKTSTDRAQRTFIGTNGEPGDIWICVSDGRYNDGKSAGLNGYQCAAFLKSKGCTFGLPLDGGGSSTMVWKGEVLNAAKGKERAVVDFIYFK